MGKIRKLLRAKLKDDAGPALRAFSLSVAAFHDGDKEGWFKHWCGMLDAIEQAAENAPFSAIFTINDVTKVFQGDDAEPLRNASDATVNTLASLPDADFQRLVEESRKRDPSEYVSAWDLNELLASWDGSDAQKKLDEMASTDVDLSPLWSS